MARDLTLYRDNAEGGVDEVAIPHRWQICSACQGEGKSSAHLGAFTQSDIDEADQEFLEDYMAGRYDRPCDGCAGLGRIKVADLSRMSPADRAAWRAQCRADDEIAAIEAAERRAGC